MGGHCIVNLWKNIMLALCIDCLLFCCSQVMPKIIWCCFTACLLNAKLPNKKDHFTYFDGDRQITVCLSLSLRNCDRKFFKKNTAKTSLLCFSENIFFSLHIYWHLFVATSTVDALQMSQENEKQNYFVSQKKRKHFMKWCEHYKVESNIDLQYFKGRFK